MKPIVHNQQVETDPRIRRSRVGAQDRRRARFCVEQMDRHRSRTSFVPCRPSSLPYTDALSCRLLVKWDPQREDKLFMNQSAALYAHYYLAQICVHRPFIPSPRTPSRLPFPSLTICTNAARSCIHVVDVQTSKTRDAVVFNRVCRLLRRLLENRPANRPCSYDSFPSSLRA